MKLRINIFTLTTIFLLAIAVFVYIFHLENRAPVLDVYFFNLDRGRAVLMRTPNDKTILIDGGANSQVFRELGKILPFYRRRIDTIVVTNSLAKNVGGLSEVVGRYDVGEIIESSILGTSTAYSAFEKSVKEKNLPVRKVEKDDHFEIDGIKFDVLFPDPSFKYNKTSLPELVLQISYENEKVLLLGDISKTIQKSFISEISKVDIVEYAHGASDSRTSEELFIKLNPKYAVIKKQTRVSNKISNIEKVKSVEIINIDLRGTIHFILDGKDVVLK